MTEELKRLPLTFRKYGHDFTQIDRTASKAIYLQTLTTERGDIHVAYEIIVIRQSGTATTMPNGDILPPQELYPKTSDWGKYGWSISDKKRAMEKYNSLK
jgi:hypothetical protein